MLSSKSQDTGSLGWRLMNAFTCALFALFAYVQKNDPDPELWMALYIIPTLLCLAVAVSSHVTDNPIWRITCTLHVIAMGLLSLYLTKTIKDSETEMKFYEMEEARELGGLVFVMLWLIICGNSSRLRLSLTYLTLGCAVLASVPILIWIGVYINTEYREKMPEHCKTVMYADKDSLWKSKDQGKWRPV